MTEMVIISSDVMPEEEFGHFLKREFMLQQHQTSTDEPTDWNLCPSQI